MKKLIPILGLIVQATFSQTTWAATNQGQNRWTHFGVRPLAMGNAFVAIVDDFNALFYNPAGLARLKEWDGEFFNPAFEISSNTTDFINDLTDLTQGSASQTTAVLDLIEANTGQNHHIAFGLTPHLVFPGFGIGLGAHLDASLTFHRDPSAFINFGPELILPISYATNFLEDRLSVGFSLKARVKGGVNHEFTIQDLEALKSNADEADGAASGPKIEDFVEGGFGYGADLGILFTPMDPLEPTFGLSITDFGGTSYSTQIDVGDAALSTPDDVLPSVNVGLSLKPIKTDVMYLTTAIDMHSINQPFDYTKKLNLGLELGYGSLIKLQTGLHQGYLSAGFQIDVGLLALRFATYSEELGNVAGKIEDRRYLLQIKLLI